MEILKLNSKNLKEINEKVESLIKKGKVIVYPTDTVYGLICDAKNKNAVQKIFKIKRRSPKKPLPVFVKDIKMAKILAKIDKNQEKFLKKVWPGKTTVVLERRKGKKIYGLDKKTIAIRTPKYKSLNDLLENINYPLVQTSANISGEKESTKIKEVLNQFKGRKYGPDLILDAGDLKSSLTSTVVDISKNFKILRRGVMPKEFLDKIKI